MLAVLVVVIVVGAEQKEEKGRVSPEQLRAMRMKIEGLKARANQNQIRGLKKKLRKAEQAAKAPIVSGEWFGVWCLVFGVWCLVFGLAEVMLN